MENDMNDVFAWNEEDGGAITLFDDDGNESSFNVLSSKEQDGNLYLLVAEALGITDGDEDENEAAYADTSEVENEDDAIIEVLHFKCVSNDGDEMAFEIVDDEHPDFPLVLTLFKEDYETLDINIIDDTLADDESSVDEAAENGLK